MVELKHFFQPVKVRPWAHLPAEDTVSASIVHLHDLQSVSLSDFNVAIAGIDESTNSISNQGCRLSPHLIRSFLYGLRRNSRELKVIELGNILGASIKDKYVAIEEVTTILAESGVPLVIIGGGQDFTYPVFSGLKRHISQPKLCFIDAMVDDFPKEEDYTSRNFISQMRQKHQFDAGEITFAGVQRYYNTDAHDELIESIGANVVRLGDMRGEEIHQVESYLRDCHLVSFDSCAVKHSDMPGQSIPMPNGLSSFQACQLGWYSGISDQMNVFGLFEINPETDVTGASVMLGAQIVWHVLEGVAHRYGDYPFRDIESYSQYLVYPTDYNDEIKFYCNQENNRWWVELKSGEEKKILSCSATDYQMFNKGTIPEKWWKIINRMCCESEDN